MNFREHQSRLDLVARIQALGAGVIYYDKCTGTARLGVHETGTQAQAVLAGLDKSALGPEQLGHCSAYACRGRIGDEWRGKCYGLSQPVTQLQGLPDETDAG